MGYAYLTRSRERVRLWEGLARAKKNPSQGGVRRLFLVAI
jgi:hypothetical protein